ncbi:M48 family metallopeptidase [Moraxella sp. FZLJ2107]|uniref:M48 family metallopeptidase n=1 Tax=unclassified Moraxella TaxID=2685852 RepID=UPI00209C4F6A|nr:MULTISPECIES: M48 family metallopeptidase [unclassified Moraxella]USZ15578.1 M48 family metallopeptidase [Moraxella sp. FZFQ2102]UTO04603.1 M48 family metallopeptidase [Moraxella sp. FZLJ2107]UTO21331.1 M48 family metallopeptidase [Moraxella sp. FZLJ2109]
MRTLKKHMIATALIATSATAVVGCSSSTQSGVVGADRKQLLLVSSDQIMQATSQMYAETISEARQKGTLDVDAAQVRRLKNISNRLIPQTSIYRPDAVNWRWQVHSIKSNEVNAYVMPGGKIVFYSGIIDKLNLTDDEIAAIMGHEMAHALREHSREKMSRQMATTGVLGIAASALGLSSGQQQLVGLAQQLGLDLPHSRTQEAEADKIGLELMARAGYNPNAAVTLWQKMNAANQSAPPQFLSTHPSSGTRIKNMQALIPTVMPLYQAAKR